QTQQFLIHKPPSPNPNPKLQARHPPQSSTPVRIKNAIPMIQQRRRPARVVTKHTTSYVPSIDFSTSPIKPAPAARTASEHCGPRGCLARIDIR
ncbi:hypothetical protein L208DRAFT_1386422, partial [Tricholoma matsutake]